MTDFQERLWLDLDLGVVLRHAHLLVLVFILNKFAQCLQGFGSGAYILVLVVCTLTVGTAIPAAKHVVFYQLLLKFERGALLQLC